MRSRRRSCRPYEQCTRDQSGSHFKARARPSFPALARNLTGLVAYLATTPRATSSTRHGSQYCHAIPMRTVECITTRRMVIGCFAVCPIVDVVNAAVKTSRRSTSCARAMSGWLPPFYICTATALFEPETYTGRVGYPNCRGSKQRTRGIDRPRRVPIGHTIKHECERCSPAP